MWCGHMTTQTCGEWWSCGKAPDGQSTRQWFNPTCRCFETYAIWFTPHLTCLSEETLKAGGPLILSGVYARGSKRSHTGGKCVTCSGLTNSREGQLLR